MSLKMHKSHKFWADLAKFWADLHKERPYLEDEGGGEPGDSGGVACGDEGPVPGACLVLDGRNGGDAGEVE